MNLGVGVARSQADFCEPLQARFSTSQDTDGFQVQDARHGRVLADTEGDNVYSSIALA